MFENLKAKWKVGPLRLFLILLTFATGGSLTGWVGRKLMAFFPIENDLLWATLYIILVTICWPLMVLLVSIPLGQFAFFRTYLVRLGRRIAGKPLSAELPKPQDMPLIQVAVFASGAGSNARRLIEYFRNHPRIRISLVVCNKPGAGVIAIAAENGIPLLMIEKEKFFRGDAYLPELRTAHIDFIVLAGFLWKVPADLIRAYAGKMVNIHPALLPKYGGKGMYGQFVHEAVIAAGEKESGITIHLVDEEYDHGSTLFQATCPVETGDDPARLAARIHELEYLHFAPVIEKAILAEANEREISGLR